MSVLTKEEEETLLNAGYTQEQIDEYNAEVQKEEEKGYTSPSTPNKDDLLKFLRDVFNNPRQNYDSISRAGNLTDGELGNLSLPVRNLLSLANYAESEGWDEVANSLRWESNIWNNTSLARKGFALKLPFSMTSIKKNIEPKRTMTKKNWFGGEQSVTEGGEE